jgi:hypothetical protein
MPHPLLESVVDDQVRHTMSSGREIGAVGNHIDI